MEFCLRNKDVSIEVGSVEANTASIAYSGSHQNLTHQCATSKILEVDYTIGFQ